MKLRVLLISDDQAFIDQLSGQELVTEYIPVASVPEISQAIERYQGTHALGAIVIDCELSGRVVAAALCVVIEVASTLPVICIAGTTDKSDDLPATGNVIMLYCQKRDVDANAIRVALRDAVKVPSRKACGISLRSTRAQAILDAMGDAVLCTDDKWRINYWNPIAEKLVRSNRAEIANQPLSEVFHLIDASTGERLLPALELAVKSGRTMILPPNCVLVRQDGTECHIEDSAAPILDEKGNFDGLVIVFHDVGESRASEQRMTHIAQHDALTSLPNRALLNSRLNHGIALARRHGRQLAVLFVDLDHFKHVNDSLGHHVGDQLLRAVAQRITPCVRQSDTVSRLGGDEFIVLLSEIAHIEDAGVIAEKVRRSLIEPFTIENHKLHLSASIGISVYPVDGEDALALIQGADTAMYYAKELGRNNYQFFKRDMNAHAAERHNITEGLRSALARGELLLEYQPKVDLSSGTVTGVEALVRWRHPSRGLLYPSAFIPIAEDSRIIIAVGQWVLREACMQAQQWLAAGVAFGSMAVNISAVEFRKERFFEEVCATLISTGLPPNKLELELTETAVMHNYDSTSVVLHALRDMGVSITVDDFGTGYSNLSYLKRFPINTLKLDRSFIHDIPDGADASTIVTSVIQMAMNLHLKVVAEGIENTAQLDFLRSHSCGEGQGYHFSKPLSPGELETWLLARPQSRYSATDAPNSAERTITEPSLAAVQLQVHSLTQQLMVAQETERAHIARELHDDVQQLLFALSLKMLPTRLTSSLLVTDEINEWRRALREVIEHLRALTSRLRVPIINDRGLAAAIREHVDRLRAETGADIRLRIDPTVPAVAAPIGLACFRIVQEALTNGLKHAAARHFQVSLQYAGGFLIIGIRDDGCGFDVSSALRRATTGGHLGLLSMRERAAMIGAEIQVKASAGHGTLVRVLVPVRLSILPPAMLRLGDENHAESVSAPGQLPAPEIASRDRPGADPPHDIAIIITDKEGVIEWVNEGFTRICGYREEEAVGHIPGALLQGPDTDSRVIACVGRAIRSKRGISAKLANYTKLGRPYWASIRLEPLLDACGDVEAFVSFATESIGYTSLATMPRSKRLRR